MPRYVPGQASALFQWVWSGGTVNLTTDWRTAGFNNSANLVDASAGADTDETWLPTLHGGEFTIGVLDTGGTSVITALAPGNQGTVVASPKGTATGNIKRSMPATIASNNATYPYNGVAMLEVTFRKNGGATTDTLY